MLFTSPPVIKSAAILGLLAVAHALPASVAHEHDERRSLGRRMFTPPHEPVIAPHPEPVAPGHEVTPGAPEAVRPGTEPVGHPVDTPDEPRLGTEPKLTTEQKGNRNIEALNAKLSADPVVSKDLAAYDAEVASKYFVKTQDLRMEVEDANLLKWLKRSGVKQMGADGKDDGPMAKYTKIYGAKEEVVADKNLDPIFETKIDGPNGVMMRPWAYRSGKTQSGVNIDDLYPGIAEADRIHMSEHIASQWKLNGGGNPMKKNIAMDIANPEMEKLIKDTVAARGPGMRSASTKPGEELFNKLMGGSVGAPLVRALTEHPDVFHNYKPIKVDIYSDTMQWAVITLGP